MTDVDLEQLAELVADRLVDRIAETSVRPDTLLDVAGAARFLGVSTDYCRQHATELGAIELPTDGSRRLLRFDPARLVAGSAELGASGSQLVRAGSETYATTQFRGSSSARSRRRPRRDLLPVATGDEV